MTLRCLKLFVRTSRDEPLFVPTPGSTRLLIACVSLLAAAFGTTRQAAAQIAVADTVRVRPLAGPSVRGVVTSRVDDTLTVRVDEGEERRLRLDSLRSVDVLRGRSHLGWRAVRWGAAIGAIVGLAVAPQLKASDDRANEGSVDAIDVLPSSLAFYEFATASLGALARAVLGAAMSPLRVERWEADHFRPRTAGPRKP